MSRAERTGREAASVPKARQPEPSPSQPPALSPEPDDEPDTDAPPSTVDTPSASGPGRPAELRGPDHSVGLDERQCAIIDFERQWWKHAGAKEQAIRERFSLSPTRYYQLLNALLDQPEALAYDAVTVSRLRRLRATRTRRRGAGHR